MQRERNEGRAAAALLAVAALLVVLLAAAAAWWWFAAPQGPRLAEKARRPEARPVEAEPLPEAVDAADAVARKREAKAPPPTKEGEPAAAAIGERSATSAKNLGDRHGRVVAATTGAPIAGAAIVAAAVEEPPDDALSLLVRLAGGKERAKSGADGRFTVADLRDDELLVVVAPRWAATPLLGEQLTPVASATIDCPVSEGARLIGRATGRGGAPIADARLTLRSQMRFDLVGVSGFVNRSGIRFPRFEFTATTDARGEATIESLMPWVGHTLALEPPAALAPDEATRAQLRRVDDVPIRIAPGETLVREWRLGGGVTLRGRLVDEAGLPLADALLWMVRAAPDDAQTFDGEEESGVAARCFTDDAGRFEFVEQAPGEWRVGPAPWSRSAIDHADHDLVPDATRVLLREGEVAREIELRARRGLFISGRAVDRRGKGVPGWLDALPGMTHSFADDEGWFRVGPLAAGDHELRLTPQSTSYAPPPPPTVVAGARDVQLDVPDAARLDVTTVAPDGHVVAASLVVVRSDGDGRAWIGGRGLGGLSDDRFEGLPAGTFSIGATTSDGLAGVVGAIALAEGDEKRVTVTLAPAATLVLRYATETTEKATVSLSSGGLVVAVREVTRGEPLRCAVVPGVVRVRAAFGAATVMRDVEVAAGAELDVVLDER